MVGEDGLLDGPPGGFADLYIAGGRGVVVGGPLVPQRLAGDKKGTLVKGRQNAAAAGGDDLTDPVADEPVQQLGRCGGPHRGLTEGDLLPVVGGDIDGVELGGAVEGGDLSGSRSVGVAVDVAAEKGEHAFPGQMQVQLLIVRADDGGLLRRSRYDSRSRRHNRRSSLGGYRR